MTTGRINQVSSPHNYLDKKKRFLVKRKHLAKKSPPLVKKGVFQTKALSKLPI